MTRNTPRSNVLPPGRAGLQELLRSRSVRLALGVTALVQFAAVGARSAHTAPAPTPVASIHVSAPATAQTKVAKPGSTIGKLRFSTRLRRSGLAAPVPARRSMTG